jgi:peptidoglycan/xylan/chitin deacetylase (PgdA/CDA1 family)
MPLASLLANLRWKTVAGLSRRNTSLPESGPIVSFTFDDFPRTALQIGGAILKNYGARGTYYAAMGLMDTVTAVGQQFGPADLDFLLDEGHELGSHTFGHLSCRSAVLREFKADVTKGKDSVTALTGIRAPHNFAYPFGHVTLRAKGTVGSSVTTCRGILPGINYNSIDLNLLKANRLYSHLLDFETIDRLLDTNDRLGGWLIFYTHDVSDTPSRYGCKTHDFERVVERVAKRRCRILKVADVVIAMDLSVA